MISLHQKKMTIKIEGVNPVTLNKISAVLLVSYNTMCGVLIRNVLRDIELKIGVLDFELHETVLFS